MSRSEPRTVVGVADGWVLFGAPGGPPEFRRTAETHRVVTGRRARVGDVVRFMAYRNDDGTTYFFYAEGSDRE